MRGHDYLQRHYRKLSRDRAVAARTSAGEVVHPLMNPQIFTAIHRLFRRLPVYLFPIKVITLTLSDGLGG